MWFVDDKSGESDDENRRLSDNGWVGSFWADGWGGCFWECWAGFSQADWAGLPHSTETEGDPDFLCLFSRNSWSLLAFLFLVEGDFFLASVGIRAEAAEVTVLLESKEQENCPLVRWKLNPIFWFTSVWMKTRHCVARFGSWFSVTWGAVILATSRKQEELWVSSFCFASQEPTDKCGLWVGFVGMVGLCGWWGSGQWVSG